VLRKYSVLSQKQKELSGQYCDILEALVYLGQLTDSECKWCILFHTEYEARFVNGNSCREIQVKLIRHLQKEGVLERD